MLSSVGAHMVIFISISQSLFIATVISIADNNISESEDAITQKFVPINFTITLTLISSILTHSASHSYVAVSIFFAWDVFSTIQFIFR